MQAQLGGDVIRVGQTRAERVLEISNVRRGHQGFYVQPPHFS